MKQGKIIGKFNRNQLTTVSKWLKPLVDAVEDANNDFAYYRGHIYMLEDNICLDLLGSDINGGIKKISLLRDADTHEFFMEITPKFKKGFRMKDEVKLSSALETSVINFISNLPATISEIFFEFPTFYEIGIVRKDLLEKGSSKLYFMQKRFKEDPEFGEIIFNYKYDLNNENTKKFGELAGDWLPEDLNDYEEQ